MLEQIIFNEALLVAVQSDGLSLIDVLLEAGANNLNEALISAVEAAESPLTNKDCFKINKCWSQ